MCGTMVLFAESSGICENFLTGRYAHAPIRHDTARTRFKPPAPLHAAAKEESVNAFVRRAVAETMERDKQSNDE